MMQNREVLRASPSRVEQLLEGESTLYGEKPSMVASLVESKLNTIESAGQMITAITPIPDYHNATEDGGLKNIFFITKPNTSGKKTTWETTTVLSSDFETMHNVKTEMVKAKLAAKISELEAQGASVAHVISIPDHHNWLPMMEGFGGMDGLKNFILCYHR